MNLPAVAPEIPAELIKAADETGLAADGVHALKSSFAPHFIRFHELADEARLIALDQPTAARRMRLELKAVRVAAEKTRKGLKEDSLRRGKAIDGINALLEMQLIPIEDALDKIEKAEEIREQARIAAIKAERGDALRPYADPTFYDLGAMPAAQWDQLLAFAKAAHQAAEAAKAKAEADRIAAEKAAAEAKAKREAEEAAERERMRAENERLAKVAAEEREAREKAERWAQAEKNAAAAREAVAKEQARKEREAAEAKAAEERAAIQAKADAERKAAEEKAAKDRAEAARVAKVEREKREAAEAELRAKEEAEAKRAADEKAAAAKAAAAPDKQKLAAMAQAVRALQVPTLSTPAGAALAAKVADQVAKFAAWLDLEAGRL